MYPLAIFNSPTDILIVIVVAVLLFGGKKIPELAKGLGEGIRNFKGSVKDEDQAGTRTEDPKRE